MAISKAQGLRRWTAIRSSSNPATGYYEIATKLAEGVALQPSGHKVGSALPSTVQISRGLRPGGTARNTAFVNNALGGKTRWQERNEQARAALDAGHDQRPDPAPPQRGTVGTFIGLCLPIRFPTWALC